MIDLERVLRLTLSIQDDEAFRICSALDPHCTGKMNYSDFLAAMMCAHLETDRQVGIQRSDLFCDVFKRFDVEADGQITPNGLRGLLGDTYEGIEVETLLSEVDLDRDGCVSYGDMVAYLQQEIVIPGSTARRHPVLWIAGVL